MQFYASLITFTLISVIAVTGIYILTGLTGMFSLGQASFMAIGAYVSGVLVVKVGLPFWLSVLIAVVISVAVGYVVGLPTVRLRRDYISLVTLGFGEAIIALLNQTQSITGGALGFSGIPKKTTLTLALVSAVFCIFLVSCFKRSKYGRQCIAAKSGGLLPTAKRMKEEKRGREICEHYINVVGLTPYKNERPENLPYGLQRRLEIARALTCQPKVLLLDEPAAGLNPTEVKELTELIGRLSDEIGFAILLIEHRLELVMGISHRIHVLNFGETIAVGTPEEIKENPEVIKAYLGEEERKC
ncbi:MAG: branched-chain amino acid ABC transporter ATP-binding protein/permease [Firmicutes bacterium]|nr:branched-chain amino acid ABC transporter ATP-binding protein/permease [Bacillota bacterium]